MTWVALWVAFEAHGPHFRSLLAFLCEKRFCWFRAGADRKQAPRFGRPTLHLTGEKREQVDWDC